MPAGCRFKRSVLLLIAITAVLGGCASSRVADSPALDLSRFAVSSTENTGSVRSEVDQSEHAASHKIVRPQSLESCISLAKQAIRDEEFQTAIDYANCAIAAKPDLATGYYLRGKALFEEGASGDRAMKDLEKAVALQPSLTEAFDMLANLYGSTGQHKKALAAVNRAIELMPRDPALYENRASVYNALGKKEEALADLGTSIQLRTVKLGGYTLRAKYLELYGKNEEALADYARALALSSKHFNLESVELLKNRAALLNRLGRHHSAIEDLSSAIERDRDDEDLLMLRGKQYASLDDYPKAIRDFTNAIELSPEYARASYEARSEIYKKMGKLDLANNDMQHAAGLKEKQAEKPVFEAH